MTDSDVKVLARRQLADYDAREPGGVFAKPDFCLELGDAYRLQIETAQLRVWRGETVAGYKIGCVSTAVQRQLGTDQAVFGHLFATEIRASPVTLRATDFCQLGIEGELALVLAKDLDELERLREDPLGFVREIFPVIELHHYVFRGSSPSAAEVVANNALQAGIVVPAVRSLAVGGDQLEVRVTISDRVSETTRVNPLESVCELGSRLAEFRIRPKAGQILLTGSALPLYRVAQGDRICVECPGVASVRAEVG